MVNTPPSRLIAALPAPEYLSDLGAKEHYNRQLSQLRAERTPHETDWRDITDSIMPTRGRYMLRNKDTSKRRTNIINSKAAMANRTCTAGLKAGIASPARPWFRMGLQDTDLMKFGPVKMWLGKVAEILYSSFAGSNFYNSMTTEFSDLSNFGNGAMIMDDDNEDILRCTTFSPGEYFFGVSARGSVNKLYREYNMTTLQVLETWGLKGVSRGVVDAYNQGNYQANHTIIHAIEQNMWMDPSLKGWRRMPYSASYYEKNGEDKVFLERKGYEEWPASTPRWDLMAGDVYATGPGLIALGDARAIQVLERRKAQGVDKMIAPPTQAPIHLRNSGINHVPGGTTFVDPSGTTGRAIQPVYEIQAQGINQIREEIREHGDRIDEAYFVNLFMMISQSDRREVTAREIDAKYEEKLFALGPMLERNHDENLNNMLGRAYRINARKGKIPPAPKELHNQAMLPIYTSMLAYAQKAAAVNAIERGVGFVGQISGAKPYILEKINLERTVDEYMDAIGYPTAGMSTDKEYGDAKQQFTDQLAQQAQAQQAAQAATSAKELSQTDTSKPSALTDLLTLGGA